LLFALNNGKYTNIKIKNFMITKGFLLETSEGGQRAKIKISEGEILTNVLMLYPYGDASNMQKDKSSQVLVLFANNSKTNTFGIPYNVLLQPALELTERQVGNSKVGNGILFNKDGENDVVGNTNFGAEIDSVGKINTAESYEVAGTKVVGAQGGAIADPTGGVTVDTQARTAIGLILTALETHGLISP
jgi:hypothetical protein